MIDAQSYIDGLGRHYQAFWGQHFSAQLWADGRRVTYPFRVFEFSPSVTTFCWVYATCGMTSRPEGQSLEVFLLAREQAPEHVELLTMLAHFHQTGAELDWGHTVDFGRAWLPGSRCSCGLLSLPYTFGPTLERARAGERDVRVLWLVPITPAERAFKVGSGLEALEERFEQRQFDYLDPMRASAV